MNLTPYLIRGLATGGQFALVAIGYTMVYGILKLINFAHGDLFMLSGIMMIYLAASFPTMPMWVTILIMIALTVFVGFAIEKCAYSPLRTAPRMSVMISAIGVSYLLQNLVCYVTGGLAKQFPDIPLISQSIRVFGVKDKLAVFISPLVAVVLMVILVLIINHTKFGMSMRAVSKDFETAQLMGVKINRVISMTFIIGSFLAAVGALLYSPRTPASTTWQAPPRASRRLSPLWWAASAPCPALWWAHCSSAWWRVWQKPSDWQISAMLSRLHC